MEKLSKQHIINIATDIYKDTFGQEPDEIRCVICKDIVQLYILPHKYIFQFDDIHINSATSFANALLPALAEKKRLFK